MTDKKAIILSAVISVLATLRADPDKQLLIYGSLVPPVNNNRGTDTYSNAIICPTETNLQNYCLMQSSIHRRILKVAEAYYDRLSKAAVNNAMC